MNHLSREEMLGKMAGAFGDNDKLGIENSVRYSCRTAGYKKSGSSCDGFAENVL